MPVSQLIYQLREMAHLPCTHVTNISLEIWKCWYIIQLSISQHLTSNCMVETQLFEVELIHITYPVKYSEFLDILSVTEVLGNFLVKLKCLYLLWKFLVNQKWWNELLQSHENLWVIYVRKYQVLCYIIYLGFLSTWPS